MFQNKGRQTELGNKSKAVLRARPSQVKQEGHVNSSRVENGFEPKKQTRQKLERWEVHEELAKGSFGVVRRVVDKDTGEAYAMKEVNLKGMNRADRQEAIDEARILASVNCGYITQHYDSFIENEKLYIVMELADKGSLRSLIKARNGKGLPEETVWKFFIQSLLAVNHLHGRKIIHRDIKSMNLFLSESDDIVLGDLGIARALGDDTHFCHTLLGTPYYLSPELCEDRPYNEKSDVWALGVVLYEMCMGAYPFTAVSEGALVKKILRGVYPPVRGYSPQVVEVVKQCLTYDFRRRPDTNALLRLPAVQAKAAALRLPLRAPPARRQRPRKAAPEAAPKADDERAGAAKADSRERRQSDGVQREGHGAEGAPVGAPRSRGAPRAPPPAAEGDDWPAPAEERNRGRGGDAAGEMPPMRTAGARRERHEGAPYGESPDELAHEMDRKMQLQREAELRSAAAAAAGAAYARGHHPAQRNHLGSFFKDEPAEESYDWPRPGHHGEDGDFDPPTAGCKQAPESRSGPFAYDAEERRRPSARRKDADERLW
mmetsp:Transcript_42904/g.101869  ORF Transcript_42904/g.101869 Transcript_42904/m.101869 type:complete len:545 (+) Transcript_42904:334-1968(+)